MVSAEPNSSGDASSLRIGFVALLGASLLAAACGGGGGGSRAGETSSSFVLTDVKYGRLVEDDHGTRLVSPLTSVAVDPITGRVFPGSLQPIAVGVDVAAAQSFTIGADYLPIVVPRNGVLQLEFSAAIAPGSVFADVLDADGAILTDGSVQVRRQDGRGVPVVLRQPAPNVVWVDPVTAGGVGFPPSPIDFGPDGLPRADATGFLRLVLPKGGPTVLASMQGAALGSRGDRLGDESAAIGFNPGNRVLDFIAQNQLIPTGESFNGFLPDVAPPRVQRTVAHEKTLSFGSGDGATSSSLTDAAATFSAGAKAGLGEWARAVLTLRPGRATEETHVVRSNTRTVVTIADTFTANPRDGDDYRLERAEFFEPDPLHPIDPATFDPLDPENGNNGDFARFVEAFEIDGAGNAVRGPLPLSSPLPPFSELQVRFSEPMAAESIGAYEDFQVRTDPDQGPGSEILSQAVLDATQRTVILRPALEDPSNGTFRIVGWAKDVRTLRFEVKLVPKGSFLQQRLPADQVLAFIERGERGVTDLGGQPLAFPDSVFDPAAPAVTFSVPFTSDPSQSTQTPPPALESFGVIVHRMQGRPHTGIDPATGNPGVQYVDQPNFYSPIADVNLQANGFLAGSPVVFITKIHDDFFPPPHGQFGAFPLGAATPLASFSTAGGPQPHNGARFQTVYRDVDASPNRDALAGTLLDLYKLSWAPIGGNVTTDVYADVSLHCAHSTYRPMTTQNGGYTSFPTSGLGQPFDFAAWQSLIDPNTPDACGLSCVNNEGPNYWDSLVTVVPPGTTYKITQTSLFTPPFDGHPYCPWPAFTTNFQYNNGDIPKAEKALRKSVNQQFKCGGVANWADRRVFSADPDQDNLGGDSMLVECRIRPQTTNISGANGFTFAIGVLLAPSPNFRLFSLGSPNRVVNPDNLNQNAARCAIGNTQNPGTATIGDNDRYFAAFDYVKTTSIITSPYVRVFPSTITAPDYFAPTVQPAAAEQPAGTQVKLEFQGANNNTGASPTAFSTSVDVADGRPNLAFRATFVGNVHTLLLPNFDLIAIPYRRP
jgi:hypothetical protein